MPSKGYYRRRYLFAAGNLAVGTLAAAALWLFLADHSAIWFTISTEAGPLTLPFGGFAAVTPLAIGTAEAVEQLQRADVLPGHPER